MGAEESAQRILSRELKAEVVIHDDGSESSMYDLRIGSIDQPLVAVEVVGAVDPIRTETWNVGPANGSIRVKSRLDWVVGIRKDTNIKRLRTELEGLIQTCESCGLTDFRDTDWRAKITYPEIAGLLESLGIESIHAFRESDEPSAYLSMEGDDGVVSRTGAEVAAWVSVFLSDSERKDVLLKLKNSHAEEKHVFIPIAFGGAPWEVYSYFLSEISILPEHLELPEEVDAVWLTCGRTGLLWRGNAWASFDA